MSNKRKVMKIPISTLILTIAMAITGIVAMGAMPALAVSGAAFTTDNPGFVEPSAYIDNPCLNGPVHTTPSVNCNIYGDKSDVWINGGPSSGQNQLTDGTYFFAVLAPGGQSDPNGNNPGSGNTKLLSEDSVANRTLTVTDGHIDGSYSGPHLFDTISGGSLGELIQLMPYANTPNNGGVYILAMCSLSNGYPVNASDCKYDAFKVSSAPPPPVPELPITALIAIGILGLIFISRRKN